MGWGEEGSGVEKYERQTLGWQRPKISCQLPSSDRPDVDTGCNAVAFFPNWLLSSLSFLSAVLPFTPSTKSRINK